jgi:hypothetical protein
MPRNTTKFSPQRLKFREFVQSGKKTVEGAVAFARRIGFPMPEYYVAHAIFIGRWKAGTFEPTEQDREERKRRTKREQVHARIGAELMKNYSNCEIEIIDPWDIPT